MPRLARRLSLASLLPLALGFVQSARAAAAECGKLFVVQHGTCDDLQVVFDLSDCDGEDEVEGKITECTEDTAIATATAGGRAFTGKLIGKAWGRETQWQPTGAVHMSGGKKKKKTAEAKPPVAVPPGKTPTAPSAPVAAASPTPSPASSAAAAPVFAPSLTWYGDFRFRTEQVGQEGATPSSTISNRMRARLGVKADLGDDTIVDFRLASGPGRTSTNQTLGASGNGITSTYQSNYSILLDRAYFRWTALPGTNVTGGRMPNPFWIAGGNDLVWDADLNFDGITLGKDWKTQNASTFYATGGLFWLNKVASGSQSDSKLASGQIGAKLKLDENWRMGIGVAFHDYMNIAGRTDPFGSTTATSALSGNTVNGTNRNVWVNQYRLWNPGIDFQTRVAGETVVLYGDYIKNAAVHEEDRGFVFGLRVGELKSPGDVQMCFDHRRLEKDAALDVFTDGESMGGGTDGESNRVCFSYKLKKSWHAGITYFFGQKAMAESETPVDRNRFQFDLVFYF